MASRVQSPSSINTYKKCPRKYYYSYIEKRPTSPSIHTERGKIVHEVLEYVFMTDVTGFTKENCNEKLKDRVQFLFMQKWSEHKGSIDKLGLPLEEIRKYFQDTVMMLLHWAEHFSEKLAKHSAQEFAEAFSELTPIRESNLKSAELSVQGYLDVIEKVEEGKIRIMDYKTSKHAEMTDDYRLQLAIYTLLYFEKHGIMPQEVGLYFLSANGYTEMTLPADDDLIKFARIEVEIIHLNTQTTDIRDYPKKTSPLCKWSSGKCDFYDICFEQKSLAVD